MTEYEQIWNERIEAIELEIAEHLSQDRTPDTILADYRTIDELCAYLEVIPDWTNEEGCAITFAGGQVILRIYRTRDLKYGQIVIK